jgi:Dyp-type peroxidase family
MSITLNKPLEWKKANADEQKMLDDLQGNILKGHGRNFTYNLFLQFDPTQQAAAKNFVRTIGSMVIPASKQLNDADQHKKSKKDGGLFAAFFLTSKGYDALGVLAAKPQQNNAPFLAGMAGRGPSLLDPNVDLWNDHFKADIHAMILIGDNNDAVRDAARGNLLSLIDNTNGAVTLIGQEEGQALRNSDGKGIEHFGYVDGRSQPLMLIEDVNEEKNKFGGISEWDPTIPLGQVLVPCPGGGTSTSFGSYFVFRKLEQNVRGFKKTEKRLAKFLNLPATTKNSQGADEELAGAMVVGRFENGTPTVLHASDQPVSASGVPNNFNYSSDPDGLKCPFAGHIRKSNPRGESAVKIGPVVGNEKRHLMARRGITYGHRDIHPNDPGLRFEEMPTGDVGLLFMAYQSNIADQFEFTQKTWVNNADFVEPNTGIDPVIGQRNGPNGQRWPDNDKWGVSLKAEPFDFSDFVTLQGGEYFFAPSITFLKGI